MPEAVQEKNPRLRKMFDELMIQKNQILEEVNPAREFYERHVNDPRFIEARKTIKEGNAKLGPIDNELAALARALGAKSIKAESGVLTATEG